MLADHRQTFVQRYECFASAFCLRVIGAEEAPNQRADELRSFFVAWIHCDCAVESWSIPLRIQISPASGCRAALIQCGEEGCISHPIAQQLRVAKHSLGQVTPGIGASG